MSGPLQELDVGIVSIEINDGTGWQPLEVDCVSVAMIDTPDNRYALPNVIGPYSFKLKLLQPNKFRKTMYRVMRRGRDKRRIRRYMRKSRRS